MKKFLAVFFMIFTSFTAFSVDQISKKEYTAAIDFLKKTQVSFDEPVLTGENPEFLKLLNGILQQLEANVPKHPTSQRSRIYDIMTNDEISSEMHTSVTGIGVVITDNQGSLVYPVVEKIIINSTRYAGLVEGDEIIAVDGKNLSTMKSLDEKAEAIRGPAGSQIKLQIRRDGKSRELELIRRKFEIPVVPLVKVEKGIPVISIKSFNDEEMDQLSHMLHILKSFSCKSVVIDLRNNRGGSLIAGSHLLEQFLGKDKLTRQEKIAKNICKELTVADGPYQDMHVVFVVNNQTSGAAEIVAAYAEFNGLKVVGERTYGVGIIQKIEPISETLSLSFWYGSALTPQGEELEGKGFTPNIPANDANAVLRALELISGETSHHQTHPTPSDF